MNILQLELLVFGALINKILDFSAKLQAGGENLFEAGSGSVRVHEVLSQLEKDELFKDRGSKPLLNQIINNYK